MKPDSTSPAADPEGRVAAARARCFEKIVERFIRAGVSYPPDGLFVRAFKREAVVEVWAQQDQRPFRLIHSYAVTKSSGQPGPKRREGDRQVPEGFYIIDRFNPLSLYHLSLRVNYPNDSDRVLSDRKTPGSDIYVHGDERSVGCLPLGNEGIEEVYIMALDAGNRAAIPVHIFPARMSGADWDSQLAAAKTDNAKLAQFWSELQPGFDAFEKTQRLPQVTVAADGHYQFTPAAGAPPLRSPPSAETYPPPSRP